ncbi:MAG: PAS domain S-box protein [Halofilum sp. (in: g-proteobacteria)]
MDGHIRPFILRSWQRSHASGVRPGSDDPDFRRVPEDELQRRLEARRELVEVAEPHLQWVSASWLGNVAHAVYLTDQDGIVLRSHGHRPIIDALGLAPGYDWSEPQMGTNGAGTALATGQPAAVTGAEHYMQAFREAVCTGAPIHRPDGTLLGALDLSTNVEDGDPERLSLATHLAFAIESEIACRELEREQRRLATIVEVSDDAILSKTLDGTILSWNGGAERLYGYTAEEMIGCNIATLVPEDRHGHLQTIHARLRCNERVEPMETLQRRKDGRSVHVSLQISPIRNESGEPVGATAVARDITRRKEAETTAAREHAETLRRADQLQQLAAQITQAEQRERRKLAQILHDDLQQVLVGAKMKAQQLKKADAAHTKRIASQLTELLDEAVDSSRSLSHQLSPRVLYDQGLADALRWLAARQEERQGLTVHVEADANAEPAAIDMKTFLYQGVRELLLNVRKHAGDEARVRLARDGRERVRIDVEDDGPGFSPERITEEPQGQALGLFGLGERLQALGGEMRIDSAPGEGTRITLLAPMTGRSTPQADDGEWQTHSTQVGKESFRRASAATAVLAAHRAER